MSIAKMEKVTIVAMEELKDKIFRAIQILQDVEISEIKPKSDEDLKILEHYQKNFDTKNIKYYKECVQKIEHSIDFLNSFHPSKKTLNDLRLGREVLSVSELENNLKDFDFEEKINSISEIEKELQTIKNQRKILLDREDFFNKWRYLDVSPAEVNKLKSVTSFCGLVSNVVFKEFFAEIENYKRIFLEKVYEDNQSTYIFLIYLNEDFEDINILLKKYCVDKVSYSFEYKPELEFNNIKKELEKIAIEEKNLIEALKKYGDDIKSLKLAEEAILLLINREESFENTINSKFTFVVTGWIESEKKEKLLNKLDKEVSTKNYYINFSMPEDKETEEVPIVLKNSKFVEPFETLTEMYALPMYDEIDPTPFLTPFYIVFFGMMVADLGYGIILLLGTFIMLKFFNLDRGMKKQIKFFHILSYPTMIWGIIYGSFLGFSMPFGLISTKTDVNTILIMSIIFGFVQIIFGLILNAMTSFKKKDYISSIDGSFAWQFILIGLMLIVLDKMILKTSLIGTIGILLSVVGALLVVFMPVITSKSKVAGFASGLYNLYGITGYIGDLVSYTRLMALGIAGGSIAEAFNMIVGFLPPIAKFTLGIVLMFLLHGLNIFLSFLGAYVHGIRLQYVEFFGKFYQGGGRALKPLKAEEKYIYIKDEE